MKKVAFFALMLALISIPFGCGGPRKAPGSAAEPSKEAESAAPQTAATPEKVKPGSLPDNYAELIVEYLQNNLIDPDSIRDLEIGEPEVKVSERSAPEDSEDRQGTAVWQVPVWFDAKSQSGKYTGRQRSHAEFKDGKLILFY